MTRRSVWLGLLLAALLATAAWPQARPSVASPGLRAWRPNHWAKLSPHLWAELADDGEASFLLVLAEQADLSGAAALPSKTAKGRYVYQRLRETARRTQPALGEHLASLGVPYRSFYAVNLLLVEGDLGLALDLAARPDVARLEANPRVRQALPATQPNRTRPSSPGLVEWNLAYVRADEVWELGYTGQGVVVAGQDTGYDWDHPALKGAYRGWNGTSVVHDYNWHDAIAGSPSPLDPYDHGTHTMGTIVGDDGAGNQIGVAPGARWIGCRNMDSSGWGSPASYIECFEFFLAPYPLGGDPLADGEPDLAPHVINNSWICPPYEGCDWDTLQTVVANLRAAGVVVVVSAGNAGSACSSVNDPPAGYQTAFSVGASDALGQIASFSSRGPVLADGSGRIKPDVTAPGALVRSCLPGTGYGFKSGTSMAAPHVTGLVALLYSAAPHLIGDVDAIEALIEQSARPVLDTACGGAPDGHPNNVYGWGIIDGLAPFQLAGLSLAKTAQLLPADGLLGYTLSVTNTSLLSGSSGVLLTDTLPLGIGFESASGDYVRSGRLITWNLGGLAPRETASARLTVTLGSLNLPGERVRNSRYGVRSSQAPTPVLGAPVEVLIPWMVYLPVVLDE